MQMRLYYLTFPSQLPHSSLCKLWHILTLRSQLPNASPTAPSLLPNACMQMSSSAWQNLLTVSANTSSLFFFVFYMGFQMTELADEVDLIAHFGHFCSNPDPSTSWGKSSTLNPLWVFAWQNIIRKFNCLNYIQNLPCTALPVKLILLWCGKGLTLHKCSTNKPIITPAVCWLWTWNRYHHNLDWLMIA